MHRVLEKRGDIMTDIIVGIILLAIIGGATYYLYSQKKKGVKCIGCPHSSCPSSGAHKEDSSSSCSCH